MTVRALRIAAFTIFCMATTAAMQLPPETEGTLTLWYTEPAREWNEALPVGNGRLGAMVFGGTSEERIQLNEQTVWSGDASAPPAVGPSIAAQLPEIRKLLFDGKYAEGEAAAQRVILKNGAIPKASYQTLGDLLIESGSTGDVIRYRRSLNLDTAIAKTIFTTARTTYQREVFASFPDQVIVVRFTSTRAARINVNARLERADVAVESGGPDSVVMTNAASKTPGVRFTAVVKAMSDNGRVSTEGGQLAITGARAVTLLIGAATDYNRSNPFAPLMRDQRAAALQAVNAAARVPYAQLKSRATCRPWSETCAASSRPPCYPVPPRTPK